MESIQEKPTEAIDWRIAAGCPLCGGPLEVRVGPGISSSYCERCHWIARPKVAVGPLGVQVMHRLTIV